MTSAELLIGVVVVDNDGCIIGIVVDGVVGLKLKIEVIVSYEANSREDVSICFPCENGASLCQINLCMSSRADPGMKCSGTLNKFLENTFIFSNILGALFS